MNRIWATILLAGAGTYAMRASFLAFAHRMATVPPGLARVLRQIPPAALAAIVAPALLRPDGHLDLLQPTLVAGLVAAAVAWKTRNVGVTVVVGIALLAALQQL
ncbi:MAG TPA: AzlD domain-containing protein [Acidimicrobiales bacterium]|jgi:branched-subunit amino acid transport protein|nr:AzlD domain-containing protein [Acidimicrobiales bacterium]